MTEQYQLFDALTNDEYAALKDDIRQRGVLVPIEFDDGGNILDGHHRLKAWNELRAEGCNVPQYTSVKRYFEDEAQKRNHIRALNIIRRHLSKQQRATQTAAMHQDGMSYRAIGEVIGVAPNTVRNAIVNSGVQICTPEKVTGKDGKKQAATKKPRKPKLPEAPQKSVFSMGEDTTTKSHVANNSGENEWYTPPEFTDAARRVMGEIDLDPASSAIANNTVGAGLYYSKEDNGLTRQWAGRVWMNPPYAAELIGKFCEKLVGHYVDGDITEAIVLVNNATETGWFNQLVGVADAVVFPKGRIKYLDSTGFPANSPLQGQAFIYMGHSPEGFINEFSKFGWGVKIWKRLP